MTASVESASKVETAEVSRAGGLQATFADWLPLTAIAFGAVLTFVWTAGLLGLSAWVLLLLV
jgi:hypothetical protein